MGTSAPRGCCWGAQLQARSADKCSTPYELGRRHFKTKFCPSCKWTTTVPTDRVCTLSDELAFTLENRRSGGVWTVAPKRMGAFRYRIVNNTRGCVAPPLVIFQTPRRSQFAGRELDTGLEDEKGLVHLCVNKGTLVPIQDVRSDPKRQKRTACDSPRSHVPVPSPIPSPTPTLCEVLVPSLIMKLPVIPLPVQRYPSHDEQRKQRNRESADRSRKGQRKYIADLEYQVGVLERQVGLMQEENWFYKLLGVEL